MSFTQHHEVNTKKLFEDTLTNLPHHVLLLPNLEKRLGEDHCLGLICVDIEGLDPIEEAFGNDAYRSIVHQVASSLYEMQGNVIRKTDLIAISELGGSSFMIFLTDARKNDSSRRLERADVDTVAERVRDELFARLIEILRPYKVGLPKLSLGQAFVVYNPLLRKRRLINRLVEEGRDHARQDQPTLQRKYKEMLQHVLVNRSIRTVFQPIFSFQQDRILGVEALSRGPEGTLFESPLTLFSIAEEVNLVYELDRLCRQQAMKNADPIAAAFKIFVNTLPKAAQDPDFVHHSGNKHPAACRANGGNVVFEINEREAIGSFSMFKTFMERIQTNGVDFAVDDVGAGYSSLETIVRLEPHFLKIDRSLVQGASENPLQQDMLNMLIGLANRINAGLIAEGIETEDDFKLMKSMGIQYGQGFFFARPMPLDELEKSKLFKI